MKQIKSLTNDAKQIINLVLDDGSKVKMSIEFIPNQSGWFYSIESDDLTVYGRRLVNSPNLLRQFRNIISFGISCTAIDGFEPIYQDDFVNGRCSFFVLNSDDVVEVETLILDTLPNSVGYRLN